MIVNQDGKWYVKSEKGKNLGGPYSSRSQAARRLAQVEYFKHKAAEFIDKLTRISHGY